MQTTSSRHVCGKYETRFRKLTLGPFLHPQGGLYSEYWQLSKQGMGGERSGVMALRLLVYIEHSFWIKHFFLPFMSLKLT